MAASDAERKALLAETFELMRRYRRYQIYNDPSVDGKSLTDRLSVMYERYREWLPRLPLSRCPFCDQIAARSFDPYGLDGLWWHYDLPIRALNEPRCPHFFAFTGAVQLDWERIVDVPKVVLVGPEVPFVVPRMLQGQPVRAVISSIAVGDNTAYPIFYFADPIPDISRINDWGTSGYTFIKANGSSAWDEVVPDIGEYDFELAPWLDSSQVRYILPDDASLTLRSGAAGCPYLDLPGRRDLVFTQYGEAWSRTPDSS